jgi:hypothetical protein
MINRTDVTFGSEKIHYGYSDKSRLITVRPVLRCGQQLDGGPLGEIRLRSGPGG